MYSHYLNIVSFLPPIVSGPQTPRGRGHLLAAGGAGGGGQDRGPPPSNRSEINEQIAVALVRLQQDMNAVITRLHTLETLHLTQQQVRGSFMKETFKWLNLYCN